MLDIDKAIPITAGEIQSFIVLLYPLFKGGCAIHLGYSPSFPVLINGDLYGYPCGHCITDAIEQLKLRNPNIRFTDNRKVLYN